MPYAPSYSGYRSQRAPSFQHITRIGISAFQVVVLSGVSAEAPRAFAVMQDRLIKDFELSQHLRQFRIQPLLYR